MKRLRIRSIILGAAIFIMLNSMKVIAVAETEKEILEAYRNESISYKQLEVTAELKALDYEELKIQVENTISGSDIYAEYELQKNIAYFYYQNKNMYLESLQKNKEYKFLKKYYLIPVYEKQLVYQKAALKETEEQLSIIKIRRQKGLALKLEEKEKEVEVKEVEKAILKTERKIELLKDEIEEETGRGLEKIIIPKCSELKKTSEYIKEFEEKNISISLNKSAQKAYDIYLEQLNLSSESYQIKRRKAELKQKQLKGEEQIHKQQLGKTIKEAMCQHEENKDELGINEERYKQVKQQIILTKKIYKKGKAKKVDITALQAEKARLEYEKEQLLYNQAILYKQLDYQIETS